ncbi:membrane protein, FxsA-like [Sorangium cellulosum]|uniref:Membrane protein, FxsA-like n=1 Tax=Sorangium cellulosum TaxID=56 RepID=A0A4P2PZY8_SORCE|nr:FxsA family protein [Sorangium cellulosum]AUX22083.1 membrane protein, FxsA-like [Sorangium cellulosum]
MGKLILLFLAIPIVELWLLLAIGKQIGFWPTVAMALGTAILGAALAKREGLRVLASWQGAMAEGRVPDEGLTGGLLVLLGAALLVVPGVLTDVAGLVLLIPPARRKIAAAVRERFERRMAAASASGLGGEGPGGSFFSVNVVHFGGGPLGGGPFGGEPFGGEPFGERSRRPGAGSAQPGRVEVIDVEAEVTEGDERDVPVQRRLPG